MGRLLRSVLLIGGYLGDGGGRGRIRRKMELMGCKIGWSIWLCRPGCAGCGFGIGILLVLLLVIFGVGITVDCSDSSFHDW